MSVQYWVAIAILAMGCLPFAAVVLFLVCVVARDLWKNGRWPG